MQKQTFEQIKELKERIINKSGKYTFYKYTSAVIAELIKSGRHGYARSMNDMLASVKNANDEADFSFEQLNYNFIKKFESYHFDLVPQSNLWAIQPRFLQSHCTC